MKNIKKKNNVDNENRSNIEQEIDFKKKRKV